MASIAGSSANPAVSSDAEPAPCPLCGRTDCADEVEAYLHAALRGTGGATPVDRRARERRGATRLR